MGLHNHRLVLLRHGETAWSKSGQHTGRTDIELTDTGRVQAELAGRVLRELKLADPLVISSPRIRALITAKLAGLAVDGVSPLIAEWDYGSYEGLTTPQIQESVSRLADLDARLPRRRDCGASQRPRRSGRRIGVRAHGLARRVIRGPQPLFRAVITRWVELPLAEGSRFWMLAGSIAVCGFEHGVRQLAALGLTGLPQAIAPG